MLIHFGGATDVLKEFASKKGGKLGKLLKERGDHGIQMKHRDSRASNSNHSTKSGFGQIKVNEFHVRLLPSSLLQIGFFYLCS